MLKGLLKAPKMLSRRRKNAKIIRHHDELSDQQLDRFANKLQQGFGIYKIDDILESKGLSEKLRVSDIRTLPLNGKRVFFSWNIPAFLWEAILESETLYNLAASYIGPNVRLDDLYVKNVADGYDATAEGWHDDNVGYRLKVFMVYDTEGIPAATVIRPKNRPNLYQVNYKQDLQRILKNKDTSAKENEITVEYSAGDCLIFDTNIEHRGSYHLGEGARYCVVAEFIDRDKANALMGKAPCGPKQGKGKIVIPPLKTSLLYNRIIDPDLLKSNGSSLEYGY